MAKFSSAAQKYADEQHIIFIDGKKLAELMIEFKVGVSTQKIYKLKCLDKDFCRRVELSAVCSKNCQ